MSDEEFERECMRPIHFNPMAGIVPTGRFGVLWAVGMSVAFTVVWLGLIFKLVIWLMK